MEQQETKVRSLIPVSKWNERHPYPSVSQLRWNIFRPVNGFEKCIVRVGKRVLIDEEKFFEWIDNQQKVNKDI